MPPEIPVISIPMGVPTMTEIMIASFALSSLLLYGAWSKLRVSFLRQELYEIRDGLWDKAHELDMFEDKAYQNARRHMNSLINMCALFSVNSMKIIAASDAGEVCPWPASENSELQSAINEAKCAAADTIINNILFCRASGWWHLTKFCLRFGLHRSVQTLHTITHQIRVASQSPRVDSLAPFQESPLQESRA